MAMDKITEAIAHFIGVFETITDALRMRDTYQSFEAKRRDDDDPEEPQETAEKPRENYDLREFTPKVDYTPPPPPPHELKAVSKVLFDPPNVEPGGASATDPISKTLTSVVSRESAGFGPFDLPPHGSYATVIIQKTWLNDDDYVSLGGSGLSMIKPPFQTGPELLALLEEAQSVSPFGALEAPSTQADIAVTVMEAWDAISQAAEAPPTEGVTVHSGPVLNGLFVNGLEALELPRLSDYRPEEEENTPSPSRGPQPGKGNGLLDPRVEFQGGGNELVNEAVIVNDWVTASVIAGMGDSYEINAIIQINAWWDQDLISDQAGSWNRIDTATQAFNIAGIKRIDPSSSDGKDLVSSEQFPQYWVVSRVEGDLVLLNWLEQFNFMSDNDTAVLASSGVKSTVLAGGNTQLNGISVAELGLYYDLIIVGGNIYDCNIIQQMNVLFDNDLMGAVNGFQTSGNGWIGTAGNLLWNQAHITNIGAYDRFESMPGAYRATADSLSSGSSQIDRDILKDGAFEGLPYLRVLYVSGDLLDLQFIKQMNVLGDADQIALAMSLLASRMDADWSVTTGGNALLNFASIVDVDAAGKTYLAGNHYSQELLVQAEFISSDPTLAGQDPDALVNEAVVFLNDETLAEKPADSPVGQLQNNDGTHPDAMQTMLA